MVTLAELRTLLEDPNETLTVEHKSWLEFSDNDSKATLAKAAIALANHGGGIIVFGMRREEEAGQLKSQPRPDSVERYNQDAVNAYINKYADPEIHCDLLFEVHPGTLIEHAFVVVPGDITIPVMCKRDCEGVISARRCYIRKPGPRSEEPLKAEEWRTLLDRCLKAGRADMLDAIRAIVLGSAGTGVVTASGLTIFADKARARWKELAAKLPPEDPARFLNGYYELGFELKGATPLPNLAKLRDALQKASQVKHTGWPPFIQLTRPEFAPQIGDGTIEAWLGLPAERYSGRAARHCDFWRADASGKLFQMRGYDEDDHSGAKQGMATDITLPVWRVGEAILFVSRLAESFGKNLSFLVRCHFTGIKGRSLTSLSGNRWVFDDRRCADSEATMEREITVSEAQDNLVEVLHPLLSPLYERYAFFELSERLVREEVAQLTRNRF